MKIFFICLLAYTVSEIIIGFIFSVIAQVFYGKSGIDFRSLLKGILERVFLAVSLINNYPHALTLFSALKLATRLKHDEKSTEETNKYNDYYLVGNLISVLLAISYVYLYNNLPIYIEKHF